MIRGDRRRTLVGEAMDLAACKVCGANAGDPCRTPNDKTRAPHKGRVAKASKAGVS